MDPYRTTPFRHPRGVGAPDPGDDRIILWVGALVGAIECVAEVLHGGRWGAQGTLGLMLLVVSGVLLIRDHWSSRS